MGKKPKKPAKTSDLPTIKLGHSFRFYPTNLQRKLNDRLKKPGLLARKWRLSAQTRVGRRAGYSPGEWAVMRGWHKTQNKI